MKTVRQFILFLCLIILFIQSGVAQTPAILPLRERAEIINKWLKIRMDTVLPDIMRRENCDMWIILCREYNEGPVYLTMVPATTMAARRTTMLVFFDKGDEGIERLVISRSGMGDFYRGVWDPDKEDQWACLARIIKERDPKRIAINESITFAFGDDMTASFKKKLVDTLDKKFVSRLYPTHNLAVGWLETRTPQELETYHHICAIAHGIIAEAYTRNVITPGVTTTQDVVWWIRQKICDLGLTTWFQASVSIIRQKGTHEEESEKDVIHRGDALHCDIGVVYLRLCTDTQELAYVLKPGETDAPAGLKNVLRVGNRLQDIFTAEFKEGRTGNEILLASLSKMKAEGIDGSIYTHPLGFHGHAAGPTIGLWDQQRAVPGRGDYPLFWNTCHSIELNAAAPVPEWGGQNVRFGLEEDAVFTGTDVRYLDGRQTKLHLIK